MFKQWKSSWLVLVKVTILFAFLCKPAASNPILALPAIPALALPAMPALAALPAMIGPLAHQAAVGLGALGSMGANIAKLVEQAEHLLGTDSNPDRLNPLDSFFLDWLPLLVGQRPNNENGTKSQYKEYALKDTSNDEAVKLTGQEIIARSGYKYSVHDAVADDGYVTQVTRIINPKVDRRFLRQPPVLLEHGGTIDPTAYIIASSIQHHPELFPRTAADGPITSWNRSLAFVLANNGFDVWLAETRGSNDNNKKRVKSKVLESIEQGSNARKNMTVAENIDELTRLNDYWDFSQDDIIAHELKSHIDLVLSLTGAKQVHLFTFSLSTPSSLAFLSIRPDYAKKVRGYVSMAPIVSGEGVSLLTKLVIQYVCPLIPDHVGTLLITDLLFTQPMRNLIVAIARSRTLRYSTVKAVITLLMGPSAKYQTLLDENVLGHMLRELSFKEAKQMCQQTKANKLQKYDYGPIKNRLLYNSDKPPVYDLTKLHIKDWIVVSAANDALATPKAVEHLLTLVNPKPIANIVAPGFNHLDLIAGFENDKYVNIPVLNYFEKMSYPIENGNSQLPFKGQVKDIRSGSGVGIKQAEIGEQNGLDELMTSSSRGMSTIVQPEAASRMFADMTNTFSNFTRSIQSGAMLEEVPKFWRNLFGNVFQTNGKQANNQVDPVAYESGKAKI